MVSSIFTKNKRKQFDLRYHISKVELICSFLGELKIPKRHFEMNWPLAHTWVQACQLWRTTCTNQCCCSLYDLGYWSLISYHLNLLIFQLMCFVNMALVVSTLPVPQQRPPQRRPSGPFSFLENFFNSTMRFFSNSTFGSSSTNNRQSLR